MDEHTIREASALFVIEEVTKLMDRAEEVNNNLENNLDKTDKLYDQFSEKQSAMLSRVADKLEANANYKITQNKMHPGIMLAIGISILATGIVIGYFIAQFQ